MMASTPDNLYVTYVDVDRELLKIWGQRNRIGASYIERQLLQLVPEFNRTQCPNPSQIRTGMFCFAKYTDDNYYRARVLSFVQNDSVGVIFVDYGNRDIIKLSNIRIQEGMDADVLAKMSEQAEEYYLARVAALPIGWTKEIVSEIRRDICYEEFPYRIVSQIGDRKILEIQFHNEDFSNYLVKKQLATPLSLHVQSQMILKYCRLVPNEIKPENSPRDMSRLNFPPSVPPPNVRNSFRPSNPPNEGMMQLNYGKPYSAMNFSQPPPPVPQHSSKPVNSSFQQINRNIPKNQSFSPVNLPNNQINLSGNSLQPINPGLNPLVNNQFNPMQLMKDNSDPFSGNNFIQILAQQVKRYIAEDNAKSESEAEKIPHHYVNSVMEVGNTHNVIVSFIDDGPWSFSVQLLSSETELQKLMDELSTTELVPLKPPIILGHPCIASSALYGNLCRGVVVSISRSAVKVYFVDFGNTEDLPSSSIYELPPKFFKIRVLSQKFSLSGLQKVVYSDDIKKFFKEVVQDELLMLRVMSLEDDNLPTCELYLKDKNIKRILNEKIRELRSSLDDFPKVGETENVVVTWVVTPQKFFVQLHKRDADLNALKNELAEVEGKGQRLTYQQLSVGFKCVCLYETDLRWYRVVITSVDSENAITVFYVDYGNSETVNISLLRRVEPGGLINQMNNQAIQCSLKGFEDKSFDQDLTQKLEGLILEKDLQMTVVSSEKELLCVQLFENGKDISSILLTQTSQSRCPQALSSPFSTDSSLRNSFEKEKTNRESHDQKESRSFHKTDKIRSEENWRDKSKDNHWNEPKYEEQNPSKSRSSFKQMRESNVWEDSNNNTVSNFNNSTSGFTNNSKSFGPKQERGRSERSEGGRFDKNRGRQEKKESTFGERRKFDENRGGRERFEIGDGKRFDRNKGRDLSRRGDNTKRSERSENAFPGREKKFEERKSTRKPIRKEDMAPPGSKFEEKNIQLGSCERGIVTYYFSPHEFFVQLLSEENEFKKMMGEIQTYYSDKYSIRDPVQAGDIVIAQFSLDKVLYRAEVIKPSPVTVRYVDYGNQEPVGPKTFYFVDKQFLKLPKQVIKCRLSNVQPVGSDWPPPGSAADKFFESHEYRCTILSVDGDVFEISLENVENGKDVARELIANGLANPMTGKLDVPKIDFSLLPNQILRLYISYVDSSSKFYVLLNPKGLEMIENEVKTFADEKKNLVPLAEDLLKPGALCLSTSDDVSWRRGNVVKTDGDKVLVWFCDRGDCVEVTANKVMSIPDHLAVFQPQAVECSLQGISAKMNEDEFRKTVQLKHHLVSVVSVAKESLSVVLYNEEGKKFDFHDCDDSPNEIKPIGQLPIISQKLPVVISHCDSPHAIYIQRISDSDELGNLSDQLCSFYSEEEKKAGFEIKEEGTKEGTFVAAKSIVYESWYRGLLMSSSGEGLEVFYIDYGNKETLPWENVKKLDSSFMSWKAFSKKVALDVKFDSEKKEELTERFFELCQNGKDVFAYFANSSGELFCEFVIEGERLTQKFKSTHLSVNENDKFDELLSENVTKVKGTPVLQEPTVIKRAEAEDLKVFVSHIDSPNQFWVHKERVTGDLHQFQDKLQKSCQVLPDKKDTAVGDVVAALYSNMWYRAKVTSVDENNLSVQFIDYGNTFVVDLSFNTVKQLTEEFLSVPVFATPCALMGSWNENSTSKFEEIILQNEEPVRVVVLEESEPVIVDLYQNGESIAEMLRNRIAEEVEKDDDLWSVYITHAHSPSDFYIHRESCENSLKELNDRLMDTSGFEKPFSVEENEIYAAEFPDDGAWYRAKARKVEGDVMEAFFIDYGNTSNVTEIKCLPSDLVDIPILAENCSLLYGDNRDPWSVAACEKFKEYADGRKLKMKVVVNGIKRQVVKLFDGNKNITEELEKLCEPDGRKEVYVSYALSPTDFYVQYVDDDDYKLIAEMLENGDEAEDLEGIKPDVLCQARFVEDGCWYRAKILRNLEEGCEVFFIDFGNNSVATELKKLPEEIAEIPPRALHCSLNLPESNIPESVKEEFINLTVGGAPVFRAHIIAPGDLNKISLKLDGRMIEETLNFGEFLSESLNHEGFLHSVNCDTDDGKNSKMSLMSEDYLAEDLRSGESGVSNETDEEKRVKVAVNGIDGSEGFKSDDDKSVSPGFVNATDNEMMDEGRENDERVNASEGSTLDDVETPEVSVEEVKTEGAEQGAGVGITENEVGNTERVVNGVGKSLEEAEIPARCHKQSFSEKLVPGSISNGIPLDVESNESGSSGTSVPKSPRETSKSVENL